MLLVPALVPSRRLCAMHYRAGAEGLHGVQLAPKARIHSVRRVVGAHAHSPPGCMCLQLSKQARPAAAAVCHPLSCWQQRNRCPAASGAAPPSQVHKAWSTQHLVP